MQINFMIKNVVNNKHFLKTFITSSLAPVVKNLVKYLRWNLLQKNIF